MAVDFAAWLAESDASRVLLADLTAKSGGIETTRYLGSIYYATAPTDTPYTTYLERLVGEPFFERRAHAAFGGRSEGGFGELEILNADGEFDGWLTDIWQGRAITLRLGDPSWDYADFQVIVSGTIERLAVQDETTLVISFKDKHFLLDKEIQETLIGGSPVPQNADRPQPLTWGSPKNVTPVLLDETNHTYKLHEAAVSDVVSQLYVDGKASAAGLTKDNPNGEFDLTVAAAGAITVDVDGALDGASPAALIQLPGSIFTAIAQRVTADVASNTLDTDVPYNLGLFVVDTVTVAEVLDALVPAGWWYGFDRQGQLQAQVLTEPGTPVMEIDDLETQNEIQLAIDPPVWRVSIGAAKNWTVLNVGTDSTITESRRTFLEKEFSTFGVAEDTSIQTDYPDAREVEFPSFILSEADADTEASRLLALFGVQRYRYSVEATVGPFQLELGDTVTLKDDRFGLADGVDCVVIGLREYFLDNRVELELWR